MNKQRKSATKRGIEWTDYTWSPVGGCKHACRWEMSDGTIAQCYAEGIAEGVARAAYPQGFEHHYWKPEKLREPLSLRQPSRIFLDAMADLMGHWVPDEQIGQVLDIVREAKDHSFQLLTKNAPRLLKFKDRLPRNLWVGVSMPPTFMFGKRLTAEQQTSMFSRALDVLHEVAYHVPITWVSFEPLSWDAATELWKHPPFFKWAVIGAATNGAKAYQPEKRHVERLLSVLDSQHVRVFFKGNLVWHFWREEFPIVEPDKQLSLF